jgi:hypothetical protein
MPIGGMQNRLRRIPRPSRRLRHRHDPVVREQSNRLDIAGTQRVVTRQRKVIATHIPARALERLPTLQSRSLQDGILGGCLSLQSLQACLPPTLRPGFTVR